MPEARPDNRYPGCEPGVSYGPAVVLNVDDHQPTRYLRTRILERAGFKVAEAESGREALECAARLPIGVVLLDMHLPDLDGLEVCASLKAAHPSVPVALISAVYRTAAARRDGFEAGADAYLIDPVDPERLVRIIQDLRTGERPVEQMWVQTDRNGVILDLSNSAAKYLSMSRRGALGKHLMNFFVSNRSQLEGELDRAASGQVVEIVSQVRPRDRRIRRVRIEMAPLSEGPPSSPTIEWILEDLPGETA